MMKKDGTTYLVLIRFKNGQEQWDLVKWGTPVGLSDLHGIDGWVNQTGLKLRDPHFLEHYELESVLRKLKSDKLATDQDRPER